MAKTKISEFSSTPANNTDIDSINIAEGCAPSGINDAIRELMAQLKDFQTGAQGDSFNGPIGTSTAAAGAFTTLSATGAITSTLATGTAPLVIASTTKVANLNVDLLDGADWASPAALGSTTPAAVSATTLSASSTVTLSGGTANGVAYLNGSKVVTSGSALAFDGTNLLVGSGTAVSLSGYTMLSQAKGSFGIVSGNDEFAGAILRESSSTNSISIQADPANLRASSFLGFGVDGSEGMRLTSTGLGIGTSSPATALHVSSGNFRLTNGAAFTTADSLIREINAASGSANQYVTASIGFRTGNFSDAGAITFGTANNASTPTERMRLDQVGNLGLGVTPSAWSGATALQVNNSLSLWSQSSGAARYANNVYFDGSVRKYIFTGTAAEYEQGGATHAWKIAASGTAGNAITFTQAMTLDAYGNLMVGTTSNGSQRMRLAYSIASTNDPFSDGTATLALQNLNSTSGNSTSISNFDASGDQNAYIRFINVDQNFASAITFGTATSGASNYGERARIDSSGNLLLGQTARGLRNSNSFEFSVSDASIYQNHITGTSSGSTYTYFGYNATAIGSITQSGTTAVLYNVTSDQRLKENIVDAPEFGSVIDSIKVRSYDWKADGNHQRAGFVAQELATVAPEAVHQPADPEEMMAVDYSKLVPMLVKEIQSLRKRLADAGL